MYVATRNSLLPQCNTLSADSLQSRRARESRGRRAAHALVSLHTVLLILVTSHVAPLLARAQNSIASAGARETTVQDLKRREAERSGKPVEPHGTGVSSETFDVEALIRESEQRGAAMHKRLVDYTYLLKKTKRELNGKGEVRDEEVQTFEAYPVRGQHLLVLLSHNNEHAAGWSMQKGRELVGKELERVEMASKKGEDGNVLDDEPGRWVSAGVGGRAHGKAVRVTIDVSEFLRSCVFHSPRTERLRGRETIALDFRPRRGLKLAANKSFIASLVGTVWIDAADKTVARLEGWAAPRPSDAANTAPTALGARPPSAIIYEQMRLPSGDWFPTLIRMNSNGDEELFGGLKWDVIFEFTDYKLFSTGIEKIEIDSGNQPL